MADDNGQDKAVEAKVEVAEGESAAKNEAAATAETAATTAETAAATAETAATTAETAAKAPAKAPAKDAEQKPRVPAERDFRASSKPIPAVEPKAEFFDASVKDYSLPVKAFTHLGEFIAGKGTRLLFRVHKEGMDVFDRLPEDRPVIIAANHVSYMDPILVFDAMWPRRIRYMAKEALFDHRFLSYILAWVGVFPVYYDTRGRKSIKRAVKILKQGDMIGIFPEGRRVIDEDLSKLKMAEGVALIAKMADAIIVPLGIDGAERICPHRGHFPHFPKITMRFGEPVDYKDFSELKKNDLLEAVTNESMRRVYMLKAGEEPGPTPPFDKIREQMVAASEKAYDWGVPFVEFNPAA